MTGTLALLLVALSTPGIPAAPVAAVLGDWRGTSICVDHAKDPYCNDEQVLYHFTRIAGGNDKVHLAADKLVGGEWGLMGEFDLRWVRAARAWQVEFESRRGRGRFSYTVRDSAISGTLVELPGGRLIRRIEVRRVRTTVGR